MTPETLAVIERAAALYNVEPETVRSVGRGYQRAAAARARAAACWALRDRWGHSYPEIARQLGYDDHTSAMAAVRKVKRRLASGELALQQLVDVAWGRRRVTGVGDDVMGHVPDARYSAIALRVIEVSRCFACPLVLRDRKRSLCKAGAGEVDISAAYAPDRCPLRSGRVEISLIKELKT